MKKYIFLTFICGIIYRIVCSAQGVDSADAGFNATLFQHIFTEPDAVIYNYLYYVTCLMGGLWHLLFGSWGLFGLRIAELIIVCITVFALCRLYYKKVSPPLLVLAIALSFIFPMTITTLHYNTLTYMMCVMAACAFTKYYDSATRCRTQGCWWWMWLCGFGIGLAFLVRIVNFSLLALLALPVVVRVWGCSAARCRMDGFRQGLRDTFLMLMGMVCGLAVVLGIMQAMGHTQYFVQSLQEAFGVLGNDSSTHSSGGIVTAYLRGAVNILLAMAVMYASRWFMIKGYRLKVKGYRLKVKGYRLKVIGYRSEVKGYRSKVLYFLSVLLFLLITLTNSPHLAFTTLCLFVSIPYLWRTKCIDVTSLFLVAAALIIPLGSDIGISGVCHWTPGLLIFPACMAVSQMEIKWKKILMVAFSFIAVYAVVRNVVYPYCGDGSRFDQTTMIGGNLNVCDSEKGAERYQHAIGLVKKYSNNNPYIVFCNHQTEMYYATEKIPILGTTETHIFRGKLLQDRLEQRSLYFHQYPVVAIVNGIGDEDPQAQKEVMQFADRHQYKLAYKDDYIRIYVPVIRL